MSLSEWKSVLTKGGFVKKDDHFGVLGKHS